MRVIHVLRKPLSEGTVAANTLKHGCGGLNIDASRIDTTGERPMRERVDKGFQQVYGEGLGGSIAVAPTTVGRWPANVILQHLDGCRCEGVRKVKGVNQPGRGGQGDIDSGIGFSGAKGQQRKALFYTDAEGKETVANWICEPGCPVRALDEQSGTLTSGKPSGTRNRDSTTFGQARGNGAPLTGFGDKGGASRFFKQVGGKTDG